MIDIEIARAERLALLTDLHKAKRAHRPCRALRERLRAVTALLAAMEGQK